MGNKPFKHALIVSNYHQMFDDLKRNKIKFKSEPLESELSENIINNSEISERTQIKLISLLN